ncbi:centromere protein P [Lepisosteus oculatus]|uniref:centromere protein P n=1 Tax=Lepisosteus oculatus TaxID=7918 RepID=UPI003714B70A
MENDPEQNYEAEIKCLEEEIAMLQEQQESNEREFALRLRGNITKALGSMKDNRDERQGEKKPEAIANLKDELEGLEEDLMRQSRINRLVLTECAMKILEKSEKKVIQQYRISGHCSVLAFQVEFVLTDVQDATSSRIVTGLSIVVDGSEFNDMSAFISRVEDDNSLLLFFRTLRQFSEWCEHRKKTFLYFKDKYPSMVSLPEGCRSKLMAIENPKLPGCRLNIVWTVEVNEEGVVTPKINLLTKMPEQALKLDKEKVAENAPHSFQSLLCLLGVEAAIEGLIKSMCTD